MADHLFFGRRHLQERIANGILPVSGTFADYRKAELEYLRGRAAGRVSEGGLDLVDERARLAKEQADRIAMENAEARGESARWEDFEAVAVPLFSSTVQRLRAVPTKAAPEAHGAATIAQAEAVYRQHQDDALSDLSAVLAEGSRGLRRRIAAASAERRRRARQRPAPVQPDDGARVVGGV